MWRGFDQQKIDGLLTLKRQGAQSAKTDISPWFPGPCTFLISSRHCSCYSLTPVKGSKPSSWLACGKQTVPDHAHTPCYDEVLKILKYLTLEFQGLLNTSSVPQHSVALVMSGKNWLCQRNRNFQIRLCQRNQNFRIGYVSATKTLRIGCASTTKNVHSFKWRWIIRLYTNYVWWSNFHPFIGSELGRAKTPDDFSKGHSLMWLWQEIWRDRHQMVSALQLCRRFFFV